MWSVACPHCSEQLAEEGPCECGLDPSLIRAVSRAGYRWGLLAAKHASEQKWQQAYDAAATSLQLVTAGNDLAAFILLCAVRRGAVGPVKRVPPPDANRLPVVLHAYVKPLLESAAELTTRSGSEIAPRQTPTMTPWRRLLLVAIAFALGIAFSNLYYRLTLPTSATIERAATTSPPEAPQTGPETPGVGAAAAGSESPEETTRPETDGPLLGADLSTLLLREDWAEASVKAAQRTDDEIEAFLGAKDPTLSRHLYLTALQLSRERSYSVAEQIFRLALLTAPTDAYFRDDALYFYSRAQHRAGKLDLAAASYTILLRDFEDGPYSDDAHRFLESIARGDG